MLTVFDHASDAKQRQVKLGWTKDRTRVEARGDRETLIRQRPPGMGNPKREGKHKKRGKLRDLLAQGSLPTGLTFRVEGLKCAGWARPSNKRNRRTGRESREIPRNLSPKKKEQPRRRNNKNPTTATLKKRKPFPKIPRPATPEIKQIPHYQNHQKTPKPSRKNRKKITHIVGRIGSFLSGMGGLVGGEGSLFLGIVGGFELTGKVRE